MNIEFTGRGTDVTDALKQYTMDKMKKISRFVDNILDVSVTFSVEKHRHTAEIIVKAGGDKIVAKETTNDMYNSIGGALDKIERQAKKLKTRISRKRKDSLLPEGEERIEEYSGLENGTKIIPLSLTRFKPMTVQEAALEIENGPNPFVIFRNHEEGEALTVLFRQDDNTMGIVSLQ
ncbi:MAG: ribosome-associated translation inhibitor RaiA [Acidobacteria bacterium]|nr:ribosome-associated translation inhibitor RaiA [Acidobacteriota bacterium]